MNRIFIYATMACINSGARVAYSAKYGENAKVGVDNLWKTVEKWIT